MPDYLGILDHLIEKLEASLLEPPPPAFAIGVGDPSRPATLRVVSGAYTTRQDRKPRSVEVISLDTKELVMRCVSAVTRNMPVEVEILIEKKGEGETSLSISGCISESKKISGGYRLKMSIEKQTENVIPIEELFMSFVSSSDAAGWNRWCLDLAEGAVLKGLDLSRTILANFDLCCADLQGSDLSDSDLSSAILSGANLLGCKLQGARVAGADLFRARIPAVHKHLLFASGMVETESVILE